MLVSGGFEAWLNRSAMPGGVEKLFFLHSADLALVASQKRWYNIAMSFFHFGNSNSLRSVIVLEPHAIKGVIIEVGRESGSLRVVKKMVSTFTRTMESPTLSKKFHEFVFAMIKGLERMPEHITVGLVPQLGDQKLETWNATMPGSIGGLTEKHLEAYFANLSAERSRVDVFSFAYPMELFINGYTMPLSGKESAGKNVAAAKEIGFRTITLELSPEAGKNLFDVRKSLGGMPMAFVPLAACHEKVFSEVLGQAEALLIDINHEHTALFFLKQKKIVNITSFSYGSHDFAAAIAKKLDIPVAEAEDLRQHYATGVIDERRSPAVREALLEALGIWQKNFFEHLDRFYVNGPFPASVFLFGRGANLLEVVSLLRNSQWLQDYSHTSSPTVRIVEGQAVFHGDTLKGAIRGPEEVGLASLLWYSLHHQPLLKI